VRKQYKHFKGGVYEVVGEAQHSETGEKMVVYQLAGGLPVLWVRPASSFYGEVTVLGETIRRFEELPSE